MTNASVVAIHDIDICSAAPGGGVRVVSSGYMGLRGHRLAADETFLVVVFWVHS